MKSLFNALIKAATSRFLTPLVIGFFLLLYIGFAFFTEDALIALFDYTHSSLLLTVVLALIPLNGAFLLAAETRRYLERRRALSGDGPVAKEGLFDEAVQLSGTADFTSLQQRLQDQGYRTRVTRERLAAWAGVSLFPARFLFLLGTFFLFAGITISVSSRTVSRGAVIEGEPLALEGEQGGGIVEKISLERAASPFLAKTIAIKVAPASPGESGETFGLYPPSRYHGSFVYPRYLGVGLYLRFSAPDLPQGSEAHAVLPIYPPGKEANEPIPNSPYKLVVSLAEPIDGSDPYVTGKMVFPFKLLKGKDVVLTGSAPAGGEFSRDGYHLQFPEARRLLITDFIQDYGVFLIWASAFLLFAAAVVWLPIRFLVPRREMLILSEVGGLRTFSRAEGGSRKHGGVYHEALDMLEEKS